jgi:hypothetical protein
MIGLTSTQPVWSVYPKVSERDFQIVRYELFLKQTKLRKLFNLPLMEPMISDVVTVPIIKASQHC